MISALIDHLWQSTLFCAAVWSLTLILRAQRASVRHWLWQLASLKFLVPFSALYALGAAAGLPDAVEAPVIFDATAFAAPVISPAVYVAPAASPADYYWILLLAWGLGAALVALRWFAGWRAANSLTRATRPAPGASPDALVTDADVEPSVARVFHPVVLLPAALLRRLTAAQLRAVLAHEHEHIARNDNLKAHLHRLVETLFWFHPLAWWIGRQLVEERERACDEAVLENGHDPGDYAAGIIAACRHCCEAARPRHLASALSGDLAARIRHILACTRPAALGVLRGIALAAGTVAVAVLPVIAGAVDGTAHRRATLAHNLAQLTSAAIRLHATAGAPPSVTVDGDEVIVRNSSLRELVALAYGVPGFRVGGGGPGLDFPRYDIRAAVPGAVTDPEDFDPQALRGLVNKLLGARFDFEIHVNQRCQAPCGREAARTL